MSHRINANLVRRWVRRRAMPDAKAKKVATLLPVTVEAEVAGADVDTGKRTHSSAGTIELEVYGARLRLRGSVDVAALRSVLDVLAQR
jgi:transposase